MQRKPPTSAAHPSVWVPSVPTLSRPLPMRSAPTPVKRVHTTAEREHLCETWWNAKELVESLEAQLSAAHQAKIRAAKALVEAVGTGKTFTWRGHLLTGARRLSTYFIRQRTVETL